MPTVSVRFGNTDKRRNSTKIGDTDIAFTCYLKDATSIERPVLQFQQANFPNWNYAYITEFRRYYFITNITSVSTKIWDIELEVDVLASFKDAITKAEGFVRYSESDYNAMIPDSRIPRTDKSHWVDTKVEFTHYSKSGTYFVTIMCNLDWAEGTGVPVTYAMNKSQMASFRKALFDDFTELKKQLDNPIDYIVSCVWLPIDSSSFDGTTHSVIVGENTLSVQAKSISNTTTSASFTIPIPLEYVDKKTGTCADYRNVEPYTEAYLSLPGIGVTGVPLMQYLQDGKTKPVMRIRYTLDATDGSITYWLTDWNYPDANILVITGNIGVSIPISNSNTNPLSAINGAIGAVGAYYGYLTPMMGTALGGSQLAEGVLNSFQTSTTIKGALGGRSGEVINQYVTLTLVIHELSESPDDIVSTIGRPLFKRCVLGDLSGFVSATGVYVNATCTATEHDLMAQYLNSSSNYLYGGFIIE